MRRRLLFAAVLWSGAALAEAPVQDWSQNIETVVVRAHPGPALWHIARNGSDVWILGTVSPLPRDLAWNSAEIEGIITGANLVYLPPQVSAGFLEAGWFLLTSFGSLRQSDGQTLPSSLPPDIRSRYLAVLDKWHMKDGDYTNYLGAIATLSIESDFKKKAGLDGREIGEQIATLARHHDVETKPLAKYEAMPIVKELPSLSAQAQQNCMRDALDDIETQAAHADAAARAWAIGDLDGLRAHYSDLRLLDCFAQTPSFAADREHVIIDGLNAVNDALSKQGKTVIVVGIGVLLRKNGLIDRLKERGITVEPPSQ